MKRIFAKTLFTIKTLKKMAEVYQDLCTVGNLNDIYAGKCVFDAKMVTGFFVTQNPNLKLNLAELDQTTIKNLLKNRSLYLLKGFKGAEGEVSGIQTGATGYGNNVIVSRGGNANIVYDYPYTLCTFRQLQDWHNVQVYVFPIDDAWRVGGRIVKEGNDYFLRPIKSTFGVLEYLPFKFNETDVVVNPVTWLADKIKINHFQELQFDLEDVDGVIPVEIATSNITSTGVTLTVTAGCNGTPVTGIANSIQILDSSGDVVGGTTITESTTLGTYTVTGLTTGEDYSVNLSSDVIEDALGTLYGALETGLAFTTA